MNLTVERVAIIVDGQVYHLPKPARHHHVIHMLAARGFSTPIKGEQGFLLSDGTFVNRYQAVRYARKAGQLKDGKLMAPPNLYSEDVW